MLQFVRFDKKPVWVVPDNNIVSATFEIVEAGTGSFQMVLNVGNCCSNISEIIPWQSWVRFEDQYASWFGVVTSINDDKSLVTVTAHDMSIFWRRTAMIAGDYSGDSSDILEKLANIPFIEGFTVNKKLSGVFIERSWLDKYVYVSDAIQDILKARQAIFRHADKRPQRL